MKFKPKYCFKKILHLEKLHFLLYFSFKAQFEVRQNDPEEVFEGDIFAQTAAILKGRPLDQTLLNKTFIVYRKFLTHMVLTQIINMM